MYHVKETFLLYIKRIIRSYDLEIHAWLNTFIKQWQSRKPKIAKSHQNTASQGENAINEETYLWKESDFLSQFVTSQPPPPIESGGTLLVTHHLKPPPTPGGGGGKYTPYRGSW